MNINHINIDDFPMEIDPVALEETDTAIFRPEKVADPTVALTTPDGIEMVRMTKDGIFADGHGKILDDEASYKALYTAITAWHQMWVKEAIGD
jgi:hypothetical protein